MLEPEWLAPGYKVREPELPDIAQALDRRRVKERQDRCIDLHIAMTGSLMIFGSRYFKNLHIQRIKVFL